MTPLTALEEAQDVVREPGLPEPDAYSVYANLGYVHVVYIEEADTLSANLAWETLGSTAVYEVHVSGPLTVKIIATANVEVPA